MRLHQRILVFASIVALLLLTASIAPVDAQSSAPLSSSETLTGVWTGVLYQTPGAVSSNYSFTMVLTQNGNQVSGTSFITLLDDPSTYGLIALTGIFDGSTFDFTETQIISQTAKNWHWCIKNGTLEHDGKALTGTWKSGSDCPPGQLTLVKVSDDPFLQTVQTGKPLNGIWAGVLLQSSRGTDVAYPFAMILAEQGKQIRGTSFIALAEDPSIYGTFELGGTFDGRRFDFTETRLISGTAKNFQWCMKNGVLSVGDSSLRGTWEGPGCTPGLIALTHNRVGRYSDRYNVSWENWGDIQRHPLKITSSACPFRCGQFRAGFRRASAQACSTARPADPPASPLTPDQTPYVPC